MTLNILIVEDDFKIRENLKKGFNGQILEGHKILVKIAETFEEGIKIIKSEDFDIIILDLYKDKSKNDATDEDAGIKVLAEIRQILFAPVIFYTGHAHKIEHLISEVVGVVSKGDGMGKLAAEIERIINSKLALLKKKVFNHISEQFRSYFWETIDSKKSIFIPQKNDYSFGYLLLRRLANSLSKENIKQLLGDDKINIEKAHPMEFYIYPTDEGEYESGEILMKDDVYYAILTPSCDFIEDLKQKRKRSVGMVLLAIATPLIEHDYYKDYKRTPNVENTQRLKRLIESRKGDRFFFLPKTPFLTDLILDFQLKKTLDFEALKGYKRIAKLDSPFSQSMVSSFIRYYNRIGFPDIDADYVLSKL